MAIPPFRYLTWVTGQPSVCMDEQHLVGAASAVGAQVFEAWEVDYHAHQVIHVVVHLVEDRWVFHADDGSTRRQVHRDISSRNDLFGWTVDFMAGLRPLRALAVAPEAWRARRDDHPGYTPFGFSTPVKWAAENGGEEAGTWVFDWCPELVVEQIASLAPDERPAYLNAMYERLCKYVELIDLDPQEREGKLNDLLYETPDVLAIVDRVHLAAIDRRRGRG